METPNRMRVAIVEESAIVRRCVEALLNDLENVVVTGVAGSVSDAIQLINQQAPELVFLDSFLKEGTGVQVLEHVRSSGQCMHIAVMTNAPSKEFEKYCLALGAEWFVDKAQMVDAITGICHEALRNKPASAAKKLNPELIFAR
jgi:DNA-binding NarL/FixJ family response regulator